jgi:hypothetical protein
MRHHGANLSALGLLALAALGGCGSSGPSTSHSAFSASSGTGLSYAVSVSTTGKQQCTTTTIRAKLPNGTPGLESSHSCSPATPGHPLLVQAKTSRRSLLVDVTTSGCGKVRGGTSHARLGALLTHCSTGTPRFRITVLPANPRVVIVGIPHVPVINFSRHPCRVICVTALA